MQYVLVTSEIVMFSWNMSHQTRSDFLFVVVEGSKKKKSGSKGKVSFLIYFAVVQADKTQLYEWNLSHFN